MKTIHVHNMPNDLYKRVQFIANAKKRSLNGQIIVLLSQAVEFEEHRMEQANVLASIQRRRFVPREKMPSSLDLLHEDRER